MFSWTASHLSPIYILSTRVGSTRVQQHCICLLAQHFPNSNIILFITQSQLLSLCCNFFGCQLVLFWTKSQQVVLEVDLQSWCDGSSYCPSTRHITPRPRVTVEEDSRMQPTQLGMTKDKSLFTRTLKTCRFKPSPPGPLSIQVFCTTRLKIHSMG